MKTATNLSLIAACLLFFTSNQISAQIGIGTVTPDPSSTLDVTSSTQGLLVPRMTTAQRNAIVAPADGLLVYDFDLDAFFFYDATATAAWRPLLAGSKSTSSLGGWSTLGNAGTVAATNFLGTTDPIDFRIRTNNLERITVLSGGDVGIGTNAPQRVLHIFDEANDQLLLQNAGGGTGTTVNIDFMTYNEGNPVYPTARISAVDLNYSSHLTFHTKVPGANANSLVERVRITNVGDVGIGTTAPAVKLHVAGTIRGTVIQATTNGAGAYQYNTTTNMNVPDYVFDKYYTGNAPDNPVYDMVPLDKLEKYIHKNRHLPRVPSRSEINKDGIVNTQAISMLTLEKVEENTLYILELNKKITEQQKEIEELRNEVNANKKEMKSMIKTLQLLLKESVEK